MWVIFLKPDLPGDSVFSVSYQGVSIISSSQSPSKTVNPLPGDSSLSARNFFYSNYHRVTQITQISHENCHFFQAFHLLTQFLQPVLSGDSAHQVTQFIQAFHHLSQVIHSVLGDCSDKPRTRLQRLFKHFTTWLRLFNLSYQVTLFT
jgi:hypothetical protein